MEMHRIYTHNNNHLCYVASYPQSPRVPMFPSPSELIRFFQHLHSPVDQSQSPRYAHSYKRPWAGTTSSTLTDPSTVSDSIDNVGILPSSVLKVIFVDVPAAEQIGSSK